MVGRILEADVLLNHLVVVEVCLLGRNSIGNLLRQINYTSASIVSGLCLGPVNECILVLSFKKCLRNYQILKFLINLILFHFLLSSIFSIGKSVLVIFRF